MTNFSRSSKEFKVYNHKFGLCFGSPSHPLKGGGGTKSAPGYRELGNMAQTFFHLKVYIKSKLFTNANLSMSQKKFFTPIYCRLPWKPKLFF